MIYENIKRKLMELYFGPDMGHIFCLNAFLHMTLQFHNFPLIPYHVNINVYYIHVLFSHSSIWSRQKIASFVDIDPGAVVK